MPSINYHVSRLNFRMPTLFTNVNAFHKQHVKQSPIQCLLSDKITNFKCQGRVLILSLGDKGRKVKRLQDRRVQEIPAPALG